MLNLSSFKWNEKFDKEKHRYLLKYANLTLIIGGVLMFLILHELWGNDFFMIIFTWWNVGTNLGVMCKHASALPAAAEIGPIEFQNQWALQIRSLAFSLLDGRPHPVSGSMG